jgi:hypothetical protein
MRTVARRAAYAVSAVLLLASAGVTVPVGSGHAAEACPSGPGAAAPAGQHWYYRFDRATHRKCWFMHAIGALSAHAAAEFQSAPSPAAPPAPAPQPPVTPSSADTANGPSQATGAQPAPHVTVLAVKPDPEFTGTIAPSDSPSLSAVPGASAEPQAPQNSPRTAGMPVRGDSLRGGRANASTASGATAAAPQATAPVTKAPATMAPATVPAVNSAAIASAPPQSAESFPVWALGFVIAAALVVLFGKMTGLLQMSWLSHHPQDAWRQSFYERNGFYERNNPFVAPLEADGPTDLNLLRRIEQSPPVQASHPASRPAPENPDSRNRAKPALEDTEFAHASGGSSAGAQASWDRG